MDIESTKLNKLIQDAHKSGASELAIVSTKKIIVSNDLADKCREPQCENFGMSLSCPPHVSGPETFRKKLENFSQAIFFKIDVPSEILYSGEGMEFFQLLHEIASGIEHSAVKMGFTNAQAYAGGPCKKIFCDDHSECLALSEKGKCRHPKSARPSMSGFGINVGMLAKTVGWSGSEVNHGTDSTAPKISNIYGLVLIY
jgi:predicted metal-binding protein